MGAGACISISLFATAPFIANQILKDPRAYFSIIAISPAIFLVFTMAAFMGYFQGQQNMLPTAISKVIEQFVRVMTVFILAVMLMPRGIEYAAAGATFGAVTGAAAGIMILLIMFFWLKNKTGAHENREVDMDSSLKIATRITQLVIPISLGGLVMPVMQALDTLIVPSRLQASGLTIHQATALFGQLTGMATPLINLPTIFTVAVAASLVPAISEAIAMHDHHTAQIRAYVGMRMTWLIALPAAVGLFILAEPISLMLYNQPDAAWPLMAMSAGIVFLCLQQTTSGILQGQGMTGIPVRNLMYGAGVKGMLTYCLTGIAVFGVNGAALATTAGFMTAATLNILHTRKHLHFTIDRRRDLGWPVMAVCVMSIAAVCSYRLMYALMVGRMNGSIRMLTAGATLAAVGIGVAVYVLILLGSRAVNRDDMEQLSIAESRFVHFLIKIKLLGR
jgi:stage V sporulation protein B